MAVVFVIFGGTWIFSCIQLFLLKRVGHRRYICPSDSYERRSSIHIGARSIVWSSSLPCDPIAISYNTRFNRTTVAYRCKKIARFNAVTSHNGRPELCEFPTSTFSYAIILARVYEPYLIFLVSRTSYHVQLLKEL